MAESVREMKFRVDSVTANTATCTTSDTNLGDLPTEIVFRWPDVRPPSSRQG